MTMLLGNVASLINSVGNGQGAAKGRQTLGSFEDQMSQNGDVSQTAAFVGGVPLGFAQQFVAPQPFVNDIQSGELTQQVLGQGSNPLQTLLLNAGANQYNEQGASSGIENVGNHPDAAESLTGVNSQNLTDPWNGHLGQFLQSVTAPSRERAENGLGKQDSHDEKVLTDLLASFQQAQAGEGDDALTPQQTQDVNNQVQNFWSLSEPLSHATTESAGTIAVSTVKKNVNNDVAIERWANSQQVGTLENVNPLITEGSTEQNPNNSFSSFAKKFSHEDSLLKDDDTSQHKVVGDADHNALFNVAMDQKSTAMSHNIKKDFIKLDTNPEQLVDHVGLTIASRIRDGVQQIKIQLHPAELGRVDVKLDFNQNGLAHVSISADRHDTLDLLQRDIKTLERSLADAGIKIQNGNLSFDFHQHQNQRGTHFADQQWANGEGNRGWRNDAQQDASTSQDSGGADLANSSYQVRHYNLKSGLDISV